MFVVVDLGLVEAFSVILFLAVISFIHAVLMTYFGCICPLKVGI